MSNLEPNFETFCKLDKRVTYLFFLSLIPEGVLLSWPSQGQTFLSFAHTEEDIKRVIGAVNSSLDKYKFEEVV
jgi:glutamate-1-semialdehyde aminotransferase